MYSKRPWTATGPDSDDDWTIWTEDGKVLALVAVLNGEQEANARLIAQAPALLEALEARPGNRASWDTKWLEEEVSRGSMAAEARWELMARAAIAAARGG